jgi:homoserine kinase
MVTVRAPATSANLGSGYDVYGVALDRPADVVRAERAPTTTLSVTGAGARYIPEDPAENAVGAVADALGVTAAIELDKGVRPSSGLGSSAASSAGAALALDALYDLGHDRRTLVEAAAAGEAVAAGDAHRDNVAPALLGGFTAVAGGDVHHVDANVPLVACLPDQVVSTRDARGVVPETASMADLVETVGNAATLFCGMTRDDPELVGRGMADPVVTPARSATIDGYDAAGEAARAAGATGVTVSGAGPGMLAACRADDRRAVAAAMVEAFHDAGVDATAYQTRVGDGAQVLEE